MPTIFWVAIACMTLAALLFVVPPILGRKNFNAPIMLVVGVPAFAAAVYFVLGAPGMGNTHSDAMPSGPATAAQPRADGKADSVSNLVDGLAARLAENPEDGKGWLLLAQSYDHLDRNAEAVAAYERAVALGQRDEKLASRLDPHNNALPETGAVTGANVSGRVSLAPSVAHLVQPTDTVFIFARGDGERGAPAAVLQQLATAWPIEFRLTDAQSMVSGIRLSNYDEVVVTARVSRSGNAAEALQGLEARSEPVAVTGADPVELLIQ